MNLAPLFGVIGTLRGIPTTHGMAWHGLGDCEKPHRNERILQLVLTPPVWVWMFGKIWQSIISRSWYSVHCFMIAINKDLDVILIMGK